MHNRVRMVVASFLIKDLHIGWWHGADWFMEHLRDGDIAQNQLNWQWVAGCGTDAAPYFRIFNPTGQAEKFDPDGSYIRRYVSELADLPIEHLHQPWAAPTGVPRGYPEPIIDHAVERRECLGSVRGRQGLLTLGALEQPQQPFGFDCHGIPSRAEISAAIDHVRIGSQRRPHGLAENLVEMSRDVDLGHASLDRPDQFLIGNAGGTVQHQGHRDSSPKRADQFEIERNATLGHGMRGSDGDGQRVHTGCCRECPRLFGPGSSACCVDAVLSTDLAELGLGIEPTFVT